MANTSYVTPNNEGIQLSIAAALPATYDQAGYEALTWQEANNCQITQMPSLGGATWDTAFADKTFCAGGGMQFKDKTNRQAQDMTMEFFYDAKTTDAEMTAFIAMIEAGEASATQVLSMRLESADGSYFQYQTMKVFEVTPDNAAPDGKKKMAVGMIPQSETTKVTV